MKKLLTFSLVTVAFIFAGQLSAMEGTATAKTDAIAPISVTTTGVAPSVNLAFSSTLRPGTSGAEVIALQTRLKNLGYYTLNTDGKYGPATANAVARFQAAHNLSADGVAGINTFTSLSAQLPGTVMTLPPVVIGGNADVVACTKIYEPVCGQPHAIECVKAPCPQPEPTTYSNACVMGAENATLLYQGACKQAPIDAVACTMQYDPVCGQPQTIDCVKAPCPESQPTTYGNSCMMAGAQATLLYKGACNATVSAGAVPTLTANTSATLSAGSSNSAVATLQASLKNLGYYTATVDGKYGPATTAAVIKFQRAKSLKADGIVGINTLTSIASVSALSANTTTQASATAAVPTR